MKVFVIGSAPVEKNQPTYHEARELLCESASEIGRSLIKHKHQIVVCSPFEDSADYYVVKGASETATTLNVEFYYPSADVIVKALEGMKSKINNLEISARPQPGPIQVDSQAAMRNAWLIAQLAAVEAADVVIAIGGKLDGPMSLLLPFAETKRKPILPFAFLSGIAAHWFDRNFSALADRLASKLQRLSDPTAAREVADLISLFLLNSPAHQAKSHRSPPKFFISYPKARPKEADFIEMVLRRRQFTVFRDDRDFGAGTWVESEIAGYIDRCDVFVAVWCQEYACSPWCFDELNYALDHHAAGKLRVWIIPVDTTRVVPPKARKLLAFELIQSREQLEGRIIKEIDKLSTQLI